MGVRINQVFAFIVTDEHGHEGVPGLLTERGVYVAMMGADMERVAALREVAETAPGLKGMRITIARFSEREEIGTIDRTGEP